MKRLALSIAVACAGAPRVATVRSPHARGVDFDGDGLADLVFHGVDRDADGAEHDVLVVYLGRDRGAISQVIDLNAPTHERFRGGTAERIGSVGDLDGDGRDELALVWDGPAGEQLRLMHGTAAGLADTSYQTLALPHVDDMYWYNLDARPVGDVDGDGHPDIAIGYGLFRGTGGGMLAAPELVGRSATLMPVGDVDGDGAADLVSIAWWAGPVQLVRGGRSLATPVDLHVSAIGATADLDGDGVRELIGHRAGPQLVVYRWKRGRPFAESPAAIAIPQQHVPRTKTMWGKIHADYAGLVHGVAGVGGDVAVLTSSGTTEVICNTQCFAPTGWIVSSVRDGRVVDQLPLDRPALLLSPGDVDGDGVADLVLASPDRAVVRRSTLGELTIPYKPVVPGRTIELDIHTTMLAP